MNKTYNSITTLLAIILMVSATLLPGCKKEAKYRIGVSQCSEDDWRKKMNDEIQREAMLSDNLEVEILSADDSNDKQKRDLRHFMERDVDLIIVSPNEVAALTPLIDSIYRTGKPIMVFDRHTNNENYTSFQGADNAALGRSVAQYVFSLTEQPRVIELEGNMETSPAQERKRGFDEYLKERGMEPLVSISADWTQERGEEVTDSLLGVYPQTNVIYAHNDRMAIGASEAARKAGRRDIRIIGIDGSPGIGMKAVADSVIDATFIYPTEGRKLLHTALAILEGRPYEKNVILPSKTAVDLTNAEIMLEQNEALKVETDNIKELKGRLDEYWAKHDSQTWTLYSVLIILFLLSGVIFLMLRHYWIGKRHHNEIRRQNEQLRSQRDEIEQQNEQLKRQHEEINKMVEQLQEATQSKLTFFTNVSHDLRTPLTLIAEPVEQLAAADNLTGTQHKLMLLAKKNVNVLMRLINQILDFRKYENGKLNLNLREVNLVTEVRDWTEAFREVARKKRLKFSVELPEDGKDYSVAVDVDKIERVLFNLLSNAFKFTPANGTVTVTLKRDESKVYLTVTDNGKGIASDEINRIFERFYKTEKVNPQGSGIGLALSKVFAELHGGTIEVASEERKGSRFTLAIPIRHVEAKGETEKGATDQGTLLPELQEIGSLSEEEPEPDENSKTVLVIDDNPDVRALVTALLQDRFVVLNAANGLDGIRKATRYVPDLIICDVMMPGIDGMETCRRLKGEETTSHIPVLMLTACAMEEQQIEGYDCGADAYITKPFNSALLNSRIEALIANREKLREYYGERKKEDPGTAPAVNQEEGKRLPKPDEIDSEFYSKYLRVVEKELGNSEVSVEDLAASMGMSRVQLYRKLKAISNYSPTDILRIQRLKKASTMLKTTDTTIAEVCYAVGFTSHSYFTKCYKDYFGESPSEVQKRVGIKQG